ncbi:MAG: hypothetical protein E1N59_1961 [Puniceicoccaceae bacterium 5H]|nr:MAG: hypothetical protein E1N59_1961 [Puniceicoccaceae bacterium 5H]
MAFSITPIIDRKDIRSFDESLVYAVQEARFQAALHRENTRLVFVPEGARFEVQTMDGAPLDSITTRYSNVDDEIELTWLLQLPGEGNDAPNPRDTLETSAVVFAPDRSESPFSAVWEIGDTTGTIAIEPFSGLPYPAELP